MSIAGIAPMTEAELKKRLAEIEHLNAETRKMVVEMGMVRAATDKSIAETGRINSEKYKLDRETFWYPLFTGMGLATGMLTAGAAAAVGLIKLLS